MTKPIVKIPAAADPAWDPPVSVPPPQAIGFPRRDPDLDARPGFAAPPPGYGEVPFFWWTGEPLDRARLVWQLDRLADHHLSGVQINYAHSDAGGRSFGLPYPGEPALFSEAWWELFGWFLGECGRRGLAVGMSDYTLCAPGQGGYADAIIAACPDIRGAALRADIRETASGEDLTSWTAPAPEERGELLALNAYRMTAGGLDPASAVDLLAAAGAGGARAPAEPGPWTVAAVRAIPAEFSIDPMHPQSGRQVIEKFFAPFEKRCPGAAGRGLNFFFSDELDLGVRGRLWNRWFAAEFQRRKGYDIRPELPALFLELGPRTPKIRLDYNDVMVALSEEHYFRPIGEWHARRGMLYGCDHGGRGRQVLEFGDYFRTQRWMTAPGNDAPGSRPPDIVKNKINSSIAHLHQCPRVWLEGFHSSGWGTDTETLLQAILRNFVAGSNLLSLHGLYYSTGGGWWEWAPPCNHFRMPYWRHMRELLGCVERLSYVLSQGVHRCDTIILYPVEPAAAGLGGEAAARLAFTLGKTLFDQSLDFDFMDAHALARAAAAAELRVSGEQYRLLVLPAMRAIRAAAIRKALEFYRAGGVVLALGALPEADDLAGGLAGNPALAAMLDELFGGGGVPRRNAAGGLGLFMPADDLSADGCARLAGRAAAFIRGAIPPDFTAAAPCHVQHRKIGPRDLYMVLGAPRGTECFFRARGRAELWDPWSGAVRPLAASPAEQGTRLRLPLEDNEPQLIVFTPGPPASPAPPELKPAGPAAVIPLDGEWEFELAPTLDNRWGDFRLPASPGSLGAEARRLWYAAAPGAESEWREVACGCGQRFWQLGPLPAADDAGPLEAEIAGLQTIDPARPVRCGDAVYAWRPYEYALRTGLPDDPGHQGYHGLKKLVSDEFIALGSMRRTATGTVYEQATPAAGSFYLWTTVRAAEATRAYLRLGGMRPGAVWLGGRQLTDWTRPLQLARGATAILLRYDSAGRGYAVIETAAAPAEWRQPHPLAMSWYRKPGVLEFDPLPADRAHPGRYRFMAPPGLRGLEFAAFGRVASARAGGAPAEIVCAGQRADGAALYRVVPARPQDAPAEIYFELAHQPGCYGGAAIPEPIRLDCGAGHAPLGDWSQMGVMQSYSGGVWYRKNFTLAGPLPAAGAVLDLGRVRASAEVNVNGRLAGVRVAPPWRLDVAGWLRPGENRVEILVCNTLANHYSTIPTRYRGKLESGLLGPVRLVLNPSS